MGKITFGDTMTAYWIGFATGLAIMPSLLLVALGVWWLIVKGE